MPVNGLPRFGIARCRRTSANLRRVVAGIRRSSCSRHHRDWIEATAARQTKSAHRDARSRSIARSARSRDDCAYRVGRGSQPAARRSNRSFTRHCSRVSRRSPHADTDRRYEAHRRPFEDTAAGTPLLKVRACGTETAEPLAVTELNVARR